MLLLASGILRIYIRAFGCYASLSCVSSLDLFFVLRLLRLIWLALEVSAHELDDRVDLGHRGHPDHFGSVFPFGRIGKRFGIDICSHPIGIRVPRFDIVGTNPIWFFSQHLMQPRYGYAVRAADVPHGRISA